MFKSPPDYFEGSISEYVGSYVVPNLPAPDSLLAWVDAVLAYHERDDAILLVRGSRKGELAIRDGERVAHTDNSPGIWCFVRAMDGTFAPSELPEAIEGGRIPVLAALKGKSKRDWEWNYAKKALSTKDSSQLWTLKLKHCHILPVSAASGATIRQRAIRNICPANHFLFPNGHGGKRYLTERLGWTEAAPSDLGESPRVIGWVTSTIRRILGRDASVYDRFVQVAGGPVLSDRPPPDAQIRLQRVTADEASPTATPPSNAGCLGRVLRAVVGSSPARIPPGSASRGANRSAVRTAGGVARRWTLNAKHGYYVKTNEQNDLVDLTLSFKDAAGSTSLVGRFCLDLPWLEAQGVVTQRDDVFDIKIVRDSGIGRYFLAVRSSKRIPLDQFRVR